MTEINANRNHKASVFSLLFGEPPAALELYNAVTGQNYPPDTKIEIVTLSNVLFKGQLNDVAFVVDDRLVVLIEHQSTVNNNIPLRMLMYLGREYERITKGKDLYREKLIKIPAPEFIVLYNGKDEFPDFKELRISDAFKTKGNGNLELVASVYNVNKGRNAEIASKSPVLNGYNEFIAEVNKNRETMELAEAIEAAIKSCMKRNILVYFLEKHGSEVLNMLFTEWNLDDAIAVAKEESLEDGIDIGRKADREEILDLIEKGYTTADIKSHLLKQTRSVTA